VSAPRVPWIGWLVAAVACSGSVLPTLPATAQIVLHLDTDAPLPDGPAGGPPALFDRVRITFLPPPASSSPCDACTQDFAISTPLATDLQMSVGAVLPPGETGWLVHVQMYPLAFTPATGDPDPDTTVDVTASLPALAPTGVLDQALFLSTDAVGQPQGSISSPVSTTDGIVSSSQVGSWAPAKIVPCTTQPKNDDVCVPGGAYWMGTTRSANPPTANVAYLPPRLVTLSPFYLGAKEVTVAQFRSFGEPDQADWWTGSDAGTVADDWCTFSPTPGALDDHPMNCVTWQLARGYCRS